VGNGALSWGLSDWVVKLITYFHLVPRLGMRGTVSLLLQYAFVAGRVNTLPFTVIFEGTLKYVYLASKGHRNVVFV
jgi:hypothetical protein